MWSYYGSKCKLAKLYPKPKYDLIIEPFAGSAWYSVLHRNKHVLINEKYKTIYNIWNWLINHATVEKILKYSDFYVGQDISELNISKPHKDLIGYCINRGSVSPRNIVQRWSCQVKSNPDWASTTSYSLKRIANILPDIKHWKTSFGDYHDLPNVEATWFIDPPYQFGGHHYIYNDIDYSSLSNWCKSRKGQVIVCENNKADWMDFKSLRNVNGQRHKSTECVWIKEK